MSDSADIVKTRRPARAITLNGATRQGRAGENPRRSDSLTGRAAGRQPGSGGCRAGK